MKKIAMLLIGVVAMTTIEAKEKKDPVVMTVAGKEIFLSEFLFFAKKDGHVDLKDKKSVKEYVELFKTYKLKVTDAEALGIQKSPRFEPELNRYKTDLQESFLSDEESEKAAVRAVYDLRKEIPGFKHILFRFPPGAVFSKDTVAYYEKANAAYQRILNGESFEAVGESITANAEPNEALYETIDYIYPLQMYKTLEDKVFSMEPGEITPPVRSVSGFHLIKLDKKTPNPGKVRIAHILSAIPLEDPTEAEIEEARKKSEAIYQKAISGEDFSKLAQEYSDDTMNNKKGGLLPYIGLGEMLTPIENAAFELDSIGEISKPVRTRFGYHVLKLVGRKPKASFEEMEHTIYTTMKHSERVLDLTAGFDEKMKKRHKYKFYPEAYAELQQLAEQYFPKDQIFYSRGREMKKDVISFDSINFPQSEFVEYLKKMPYSKKLYSLDFMDEMLRYFIHDITTEIERRTLEHDYPEYNQLVKEYYDGILLFEISNKRVWGYPLEEQAKQEAEWIKELNEKYPVEVNWKILNKLKKYMD